MSSLSYELPIDLSAVFTGDDLGRPNLHLSACILCHAFLLPLPACVLSKATWCWLSLTKPTELDWQSEESHCWWLCIHKIPYTEMNTWRAKNSHIKGTDIKVAVEKLECIGGPRQEYIKIRHSCLCDYVDKFNRLVTDWEKTLEYPQNAKELISRLSTETLKM